MNLSRPGNIGWIGIALCLSIIALDKVGQWIGLWKEWL